jgi:hypothetical protein
VGKSTNICRLPSPGVASAVEGIYVVTNSGREKSGEGDAAVPQMRAIASPSLREEPDAGRCNGSYWWGNGVILGEISALQRMGHLENKFKADEDRVDLGLSAR